MCVCVSSSGLLFRCHCSCCAAVCSRACISNDSPISFMMACVKLSSADSAPRAYSSDSPLDEATLPCSLQSLVMRNWSTKYRVQEVLLLVIGSPHQSAPPKHLKAFCIRECVTSPDRESRVQGIQEFCRLQTRNL